MRLVVDGGGFIFYFSTQHIKLDMEASLFKLEEISLINHFKEISFAPEGSRLYKGGDPFFLTIFLDLM